MATVTEALKNHSTRWKFILIVVTFAVLFFLIRVIAFPAQLDATTPAIDNFLARALEASAIAMLTGLVIHVLALWLGPDHKSIALIQILDRRLQTDPVFERAFKTTRAFWYFKGGFGTYFRSTTLPSLLRDNKTALDVMLVVINLSDADLVESYAEYRKQASGKGDITSAKVQSEIRETIKFLARTVKERPGAFSSAKIAFVDSYSPFRLDFFDTGVVLTQDNEKAPAIEFSGESTYYQGFRQEFEQLKKKALDLTRVKDKGILMDDEKLFEHLRIPL